MAFIGELLVVLGANIAPLTAGMAKAKADVAGFGSSAESSLSNVTRTLGLAGAAIAGGTAIIGAAGIKMATDFQAQMEQAHTQAGATQAEVARQSQAILQMATQLPQSPQQIAQGYFYVASAQLKGAEATNVLKAASEGAAMSGADEAQTVKALIAAHQSGVKGITDYSQAMGVLNGIVGSGSMTMQDLVDALGTGVLSTAKNYGVTIQSVGAALASMTDQGIPAVDAANRINSAMRLMAAPTAQATKLFQSVGMSQLQMAQDMRKGGMLLALQDLEAHLKSAGLDANQTAAFIARAFGGKQSTAILTLMGNLGLYEQKQVAVNKASSDFASSYAAYQQSTEAQAAELKSSIQVLMIAIGQGLLPAVNQVMHVLSPIISGIAMWAQANPKAAATILMIVGGLGALAASLLILGPLFGALAGGVGLVVTAGEALAVAFGLVDAAAVPAEAAAAAAFLPVIAVIALVGAAVLLLVTHWQDFQRGVAIVIQAVVNVLKAFVGIVGTMAQMFLNVWLAPVRALNDLLGGLPARIFGPFVNGFENLAINAAKGFLNIFGQIPAKVAGILAKIPGISLLGGVFSNLGGIASNVAGTVGGVVGSITGGGRAAAAPVLSDQRLFAAARAGAATASATTSATDMAATTGTLSKAIQDALSGTSTKSSGGGGSVALPPAVSAGTTALAQSDALKKAQEQLALAQAKAAGANTTAMTATDKVTNAQDALTLATAKLKDARTRLAAAEDAHYKTAAARQTAIDKAQAAVKAAENNLEIANTKLATARTEAATAASKASKTATTAVSSPALDAIFNQGAAMLGGISTFNVGGVPLTTGATTSAASVASASATTAMAPAPTAATGPTAADQVVTLLQQMLAALRQTRPLVENMTINNPEREPAGRSIADELRAVGQLGLGSTTLPVLAGGHS